MTPLMKYIFRKTVRYVSILFIVLTVCFILPRVMPGDPVDFLLGEPTSHVDQAVIDSLKERYGLDKPVLEQYMMYLQSIFTWDFGFSISQNSEIAPLITYRLYCSMLLIAPSLAISSIVALAFGIYSGRNSGKRIDTISIFISTFVITIPSFILCMLVITIFSYELGWFPLGQQTSGNYSGFNAFADYVYHLILPVAVLSFLNTASKFLMIRNTAASVNNNYYVFAAKARGLGEETIRRKYILRNILPPFLSILVMNIGFMVSGSMLIEIVFSLNGMGTLVYDSISTLDYKLIQSCFIIITICSLIASFTAELLYGIVDPRAGDSYVTGKR